MARYDYGVERRFKIDNLETAEIEELVNGLIE